MLRCLKQLQEDNNRFQRYHLIRLLGGVLYIKYVIISEGSMVNMHQIYLQYVLFTCKLILSIEKETPKVLTLKF